MQIAHCYFLRILYAHYVLVSKTSSLTNVCFIAGKAFIVVNTTLKMYVFFLMLIPK